MPASLDANLEIWPSGHAADYKTYITEKKSVVDIGLLGPDAKIGWYVPSFVIDEHPELATWEGFKDPALAKLFATAETGDQGQFLMGDPSYVSYDEQIIKNLNLPLKFVVAGSEAALITAIQNGREPTRSRCCCSSGSRTGCSRRSSSPRSSCPTCTDACLASAAANDGKYACDYADRHAVQGGQRQLEQKNKKAFDFLSKFAADHRAAERDRGHDRR